MAGRRLAISGSVVTAFLTTAAAAGPIGGSCLYRSKLYSDGALICVQRSLMLGCSSDGVHASWRAVTDQSLQSRCVGPAIAAYQPPERRTHRIHTLRYRVSMPVSMSAKCFDFAGKRYCE